MFYLAENVEMNFFSQTISHTVKQYELLWGKKKHFPKRNCTPVTQKSAAAVLNWMEEVYIFAPEMKSEIKKIDES